VTTWKVQDELSEAKQFAVAIYNITMVGGIAYFLSIFLEQNNAAVGMILRILGQYSLSWHDLFIA
jgi:hypothetical protein